MTEATCAIKDCGRGGQLRRGWCDQHYQRWRKNGDPLAVMLGPWWPDVCRVGDCDRKANEPGGARGYCRRHYVHWKKHGDPEAKASCAGCGSPIPVSPNFTFCTRNPECRRQAKALTRARNPEARRLARAREDKVKRRASEARYKARIDRTCVRPGCGDPALQGVAYCRSHNSERAARRYARIKLRLPLRLYERQVGMCPDADHGGCGLPLGDVASTHVDHLVPIARNGPDDDWNLQLMHPECNLRKSDSLVPAGLIAAVQHDLALSQPDGTRQRAKPACLL